MQKNINVGLAFLAAAALLLALFAAFNVGNVPEARGTQNFGSVTLGEDITDVARLRSILRTYDGTDYWEDIDVGDVVGTPNNGWQAAYNVTDWSGETAMTAIMGEIMVTTATTQSEAYGADFMAKMYGIEATGTATGIGVFGEVIATYTSTWPLAYAVYGQLDTAGTGDNSITDGSVFYADLYGDAQDFGTVDVLSLRPGDTYDYGIDFSGATAMTADIVFQNGTELEEVTDTVLTFSEFLAAKEQTACVVGASYSITPTGTYQPLTSIAPVTTSATTAIISGTVNGQLLILVNENAADAIIILDGANTKLGGDKTLTGGEGDTIFLMWDGADWLAVGYNDN